MKLHKSDRHSLKASNSLRTIMVIAVISSIIGIAESAQAVSINFDTDASGNALFAPNSFETPLTNLYSSLGVNFSSPTGPNNGGAILNQTGNFGVNARSGIQFLGFNKAASYPNGGIPTDPEILDFSTLISDISIFSSGGDNNATFQLQAFDFSNVLLGTSIVNTLPNSYGNLSFTSGSNNISKVILTQTNGDGSFLYDDLSFNSKTPMSVPEPFTIIGSIVGGTAAFRMRKKLKAIAK